MVLVISMVLDKALQETYEAFISRFSDSPERVFKKLSGQTGPLASPASRLLVAYGYGLVNELVFRNFEIIRVVRNILAHQAVTFSF